MASRKKNYRNRNAPVNRYDDNKHPKYSGSKRGGSSSNRDNHYFCDICGYTIPQSGNVSPMCTRCMIPMSVMRKSSIPRSKNGKKPSFDYSSRIYFQTEGHPQYKGLPLDHPDPEDPEAVNAYKMRVQSKRKRAGKPPDRDHNPRHKSSKQKHPRPSSNKNELNEKQEMPEPEKTDRKPDSRVKQAKPESPTKSPSAPKRRVVVKKSADRSTKADKPVNPKEEDYAGTALTNDRSAATILSDTIKMNSDVATGDLKSDYNYKKETPDKPKKTIKKSAKSKTTAKSSE